MVLKKTFAPKLRSMVDWDRIDQPYMDDFLSRDVRDFAINAQAEMWEKRTDPTRPSSKPGAHACQRLPLQRQAPRGSRRREAGGTMSGPKDKKTPYYWPRLGGGKTGISSRAFPPGMADRIAVG